MQFNQPDTLIVDPNNPLDWNRYSYVHYNPIRYSDPSGHRIDDGCRTEGCPNIVAETAYAEKRYYYQNCQSGYGGGCPDYAGAIVFGVTGLAAVGVAGTVVSAAADAIIGWASGAGSTVTTVACSDGDCTNELGKLTNIGKNTWESTKGLIYGPDLNYGNRVMHVLRHTVDDTSRAIHGVFSVGQDKVLPLLDKAWESIQTGGSNVISTIQQGVRTTYIVDMSETIGYIGGKYGLSNGNPTTTLIQIVAEGNNIITAYPVTNP